jgi:1-acyl-sn-glycerol-3-phosphate acyltransferase
MSTAETFLLASMVLPWRPITFVVKQALIEYPVFKHIMRSRDPIVVGRENPREDLKAVLGGGQERLQSGISVVIFPQRTRTVTFDRSAFNTIGAKLASRAGVPIVPLALKTNAWSNGKRFKDLGPFLPHEEVRFAFGEPISPEVPSREAQAQVVAFIETHLKAWGVPVK